MQDIYEVYKLIGNNLKKIRNKFDDSQEKLADKIDMSRGFISRIESEGIDTGISIDTLFAIAKEYNIDIRDFFEGYETFLDNKNKNQN